MKEIKILIRNLRQYPDNSFVVPDTDSETENGGLEVIDVDGKHLGYIEISMRKDIVITE